MEAKYGISDTLLEEIVSISKKHEIQKIILFGSRARGDSMKKSDIDIAVYGGDASGFYYDLEENAHTLLMFDVVDLDKSVSEDLRNEIRRDGIVIYEKV